MITMITKKDFLDYAFESALTSMNFNAMQDEIAEDVIATGMKAYAADQGLTFTDEEIHATIVAGIESMKAAGSDFKIQTWTMK